MSIERYGDAIADAGGTATVRLAGSSTPSQVLVLRSLTVSSTSSATPEVRAYMNLVDPTRLRGGSRDGRFDQATGEGERLGSGDVLILQWTGCTPGAVCTAAAVLDADR